MPKYEDLSVLQGQIISARRASPEFVVELANGEKVGMEWPGNYSLIGGIKSNGPLFGDNGVLKGCQAEIKYAPMRFVLGEHLRIWGLHCRNASLKFDYSEINTRFNNSLEGSKFFFSWSLVLIYILSFILFLREKRGHL